MKQRKFRKIPSLDFRYEVSRDGLVRNVKSKKVKKQQKSISGVLFAEYKVNKTNPNYPLIVKMLHEIVAECWGPKTLVHNINAERLGDTP